MLVDQSQLDDLLDARAEIRRLRQEVLKKRLALRDAKAKLSTAVDKIEDTLTEIEQRQGRLPFDEAEAVEVTPPPNGSEGRRPRRREQAGARA